MPMQAPSIRVLRAHLKAVQADLLERRAKRLADALVAACAVVAHADGRAAPEEARRMLAVMRSEPMLSLVPAADVATLFARHGRAFQADPRRAQARALRSVARLAREPREARLVLNACLAVSQADGRVHPAELEATRLVRAALGLGPDPGSVPALPPAAPPRGGPLKTGAAVHAFGTAQPKRTEARTVHRASAGTALALAG